MSCNNTAAVNNGDGAPCIFLDKIGPICYEFEEIQDLVDKSFTLSYAMEGDNWVFFHDYVPDYYFHTREKLHLLHNSSIYTANTGPVGQYFNTTPKSFFVDVVFRSDSEMVIDSLNWVTEVINQSNRLNEEFSTLTHITLWNSWQCTGRISLAQVFDTLEVKNVRKTQSEWHFNDFRDLVVNRGAAIVGDILSDFAVNTANLNPSMPWFDKHLMEDKYVVVRFEFDNSGDKVVLLHDVNAEVTKSER